MIYFSLRENFVLGTMFLSKFNCVIVCENWLISCDCDTHNLIICKNKRHIQNQRKKNESIRIFFSEKKVFQKHPPGGP